MPIRLETHTLPAYWASYLINGDCSGMEDDEIIECDEYCACHPGDRMIDDEECEGSFKHYNDANNVGGDVIKYTLIIQVNES